MAGSIKGIIVEIGGDTSGLQKALSKVNSATSSLSKELRGINSLLKLDPSNTTLVAQKQEVLAENIKNTSEKLEELKYAQEEADKTIANGGEISQENYRNLQREIILTENKLKELQVQASKWTAASEKLKKVSENLNKIGTTLTNVGKKLTTTVTVPIVAIGTLATKSAIEFQSAFTGVEKTVDGTAEQMANLKQGIRDMAKEIPASTTEISAVAEAAGQLGIATDDILDFTRVMIDLGNSTNLSAEEAASSLAKFANVTKMSAKDYDKLGSTIVALGNNFATTEADIVNMATNLASTGELAGLSQPQILALATAMSSVGIEAEAGGSAMSKLLKKIQVATETGGKDLNKFASVAGMTSNEFKKAFEKDAVSALSSFISGLNNTERNGKSAISVLNDMGLTEVRLSNTILSLANASDVMQNAVEMGNEAWNENTALTNEASKRYETLESKMKIVKQKFQDIGITIGNIIMPYVEKFANKLSELTDKFSNLSPKTQEFIVKAGAIIALLGPAILIIGKVFTALSAITGGLSKLCSYIAKTQVGLTGLSKVFTILSGPVGIAIGVIVALIATFTLLWNKSETFRNSMTELGNKFVQIYNDNIKPSVDNIKEILVMLWNDVIKPIASYLWDTFSPIIEKVFVIAGNVIASVFEKISIIIKGVTGVLKGLIEFITGVFSGDWEKAWNGIKTIFGSVFDGLKSLFKAPINWIIEKLNSFLSSLNNIKIPDWVPEVGGKGFNMPKIPMLAKGGIVNKATLAMIGEGKSAEAVIPLDKTLTKYFSQALKEAGANKGSITVQFYPQQMTEGEMDKAFNYINRKFGMAY